MSLQPAQEGFDVIANPNIASCRITQSLHLDGDRVVGGVLCVNALIALAALLAFFNIDVLPSIGSETGVNRLTFILLAAGFGLWLMICISDKNAAKRLKSWADLFWHAWSYYGVYSLACVVLTGKGNVREVLPHLSANLLTPIVIGILLNALIRIILALNEIFDLSSLMTMAAVPDLWLRHR